MVGAYGRHQRQREHLAKDCRVVLGRFRLWRELGGGVREIGGAIRGQTEVLGRFRAELEDRLRWELLDPEAPTQQATRCGAPDSFTRDGLGRAGDLGMRDEGTWRGSGANQGICGRVTSDRTSYDKPQCNCDFPFPVVCRPKSSISKTAKRMAGEATALGRSGSAESFESGAVGRTSGCPGPKREGSSTLGNQ